MAVSGTSFLRGAKLSIKLKLKLQNCNFFAILYRSVIGTTLLQVDPGYLQLAHRETSRQLDLFAVFFEFPRRLTQRQVVHSTSLQKTRSAEGHQRNVYDAFGTNCT